MGVTTSDWRALLDGLSVEERVKALLSYELAADRAAGQPVEIALTTLRAVVDAEGLDPRHPWVTAAAAHIGSRQAGAFVAIPTPSS